MPDKDNGEDVMAGLFPGQSVELGDTGMRAVVHAIGIAHLKRFNAKLQRMVLLALSVPRRDGSSNEQYGAEVAKVIAPVAVAEFIDLIEACTVLPAGVEFDRLPHWCLPPIADAWIKQSFEGAEKIRPWAEAVKSALERFRNLDAESSSMLATLSKRASPRVTVAETS